MQKNQVAYIGLNNLFGRIVTSLLKQSPNISKLVLYDDKNGGTVQSYTNGPDEESNVTTIYGRERLPSALTKADIVVIGDELFQTPSPDSIKSIGYKAAEYARLIAAFSPNAILVIAAYPLNYVLPIFASVLEAAGCFDPRRLLGATSCDTLRASTLLSSRLRLSPQKTILPVIGGASSKTRIPLFSQANSPIEIDQDTKLDVVDKLKLFDGTEYSEADVIERAYASVRFTHSVLAARTGFSPIPEIALTRNEEIPNVEYFSMPLLIGKDGVEKIMKLPKLSPFESNMLQSAVECLNADISASKKLMIENNISDDVQDLGVQLRLIEDNEEQISKKHYDIQNQELQDKSKEFVELDSVLTGVRNDVYADTVKNEENVKINLPSIEEIHKVTTTFVMPHDKYSKELGVKTPPVSSPSMHEKAEDVDLMINNILPKNNGLPFNKVTLSQVKKDIVCTKTEAFPDNLTYRRTGLGKYAPKEKKSPKSFVFKPTPPTNRVYNYLKKAKKSKVNFPSEKLIMKKDIQAECSFRKDVPRKLPLPVKLKINKTGAKLAESEQKIGVPLESFNAPIRENDELEDTIYLSDVRKLTITENPDTYVDLTAKEKSQVPFENENVNNIAVDTSTIELDKLQKDNDQADINTREVVENANKQMLKNQGIIDEKLDMSQNTEDRLNVLEVRDMAKRFAKLEEAIQKVLNMSQKPALEAGKIEPKNTENLWSATENETSNMPKSQMEVTTQNVNLVSPPERKMLDIPEQIKNFQNETVQQESPINALEGQFVKAPEVSSDENTKTEPKVADQFDTSQQKLPETEFVYKESMGFAPIQQKVSETEVVQQCIDFAPIQEETVEICTADPMVNQNKFVEAIEESQEVNQNTIVNSQESPKFPNIEIHKREQIVINENTNQLEPPTKAEDNNLNLSTTEDHTEDHPKTDQLLNSQKESSNFLQFETALNQIIKTAPKSLPEASTKLEETKPQVLNIKEKTIIKLQELINKPKPQIKKFEFFKELHERFELEKRLRVNMIKNTKIQTIPEYVQNVSESKISDLKSPSLSNKLNENLENNEEVPDSFLLFKKAFDHVLSTSSSVNLEDNNKEFQNNAVLNTAEKSSVNLVDSSKEELHNKVQSSSKTIKKETKIPDMSENIEKELSALVNKLKKNKDVGEADKILRKLYSELSEEIKTKNILSINTDNTSEKPIESIKTLIPLSPTKHELKTKSIEKKSMLHVKSLETVNKQIELKDSEIPSDDKRKINLGLEDLMINIKKNNLELANKKQSEKNKDGKIKIILARKSKLKEKIIKENEVKADTINLPSDNQPKEITRIEVEADKIYLGSDAQSKELGSIKVKADKINLESDAQLKEIAVLKDDTKLVKNEINPSTSNMNPNELCINPFGPWCKETSLLDLNIPLSEFKMVKKAIKINKEENVKKPDETKKEILLTINPTVVPFVKEDSLKIIKKETIAETESTSKTNENKSESLKTKIAFHRKRRRPKAVAMLRCLNRNNDDKFKIVKLEVRRNRMKSKPMIKPEMVKTEESKVDEIKVKKVVLPKTDFILKASQKIAETRSKSRRNIINENKQSELSNKKIVRSLRAKQIYVNKDLKMDESNKLSGDNPVNKFLAKAMAKKKLKEAAALSLKANSRKKRNHVEVKDSVKPYGFSLPNEKKSGPPKSEKVIAEKKASIYSKKVVSIHTNSHKSENNENNIKISLISDAKTEKPGISIMKKVEKIVFKKIEQKKSGDHNIDGEKMKEKLAFDKIEPKKSGDQKIDGDKIKMKEKITFNKIEPKKSGEQKIEREKMKNDNLNLKVLNDPFPKNEKHETDICLVGSGTPFPDWSPIADDFIPIAGEINPSSGLMGMKTEIGTKSIEEIPEIKRPFDLVIAPQSQESTEQKKKPINSNPESKLSTIKLELESTKAAVNAHNLNAKPQHEKKIGSRLNSLLVWETKNNPFKATSNKVRENIVSKAKLNEKSNIMTKSISNEAKVVKSASMLVQREAHIKSKNFSTPKSSKSLANMTSGLKQVANNFESTSTTSRSKSVTTKSKSNLHVGTKGNLKQSKSNTNIFGVKIAPKSETASKKGFSIKKREDKVRITSSEKLLKSKKYEYNIGKIKGGIKKIVAEEAYKSKHIHTQTDLQAKQDDKFNKENTIKGIIDLRNKQRSESTSDHSSVTDIAQKSLNESLKHAILLNAKEATKEVFANRKIDITKTEEKLNIKQEKKDNPILKNKQAPTPVFKKPAIKQRVETTTEKKPIPENLADSVSFLDNNEGKPRLPLIKPPQPLRAPFPSELNTVPERKLKSINFEAHVQNLMKKLAHDTERKQAQDAERRPAQDAERKQARDSERKLAQDAERKRAQDAKRKHAQEEERKQAQDAERKQACDTERKNSVEEISNKSDMPEKNTQRRHPIIQKIERNRANETTPLKAPGGNTRKSNMPERHIQKIESSTPKKKSPNPEYAAQELLNNAFEIRPSSINVHRLLPQKSPRTGNSMSLPSRSPPPQSPEKNEGNKRNDVDYFKDFNDPYIQQIKPNKNHLKLTEMKFMHEKIQKNNSIYQNLSNSSHEKLIAAQMPISLKSAPHPIVPKKPVQQPTKKNVAAEHQESPKPIVREKRENTKPVRLIKPDKINVQPLENPNIVTTTKPETSASESKKDGWGKLFNIFKQIISRDLEEEQVERLRTESTSTK